MILAHPASVINPPTMIAFNPAPLVTDFAIILGIILLLLTAKKKLP